MEHQGAQEKIDRLIDKNYSASHMSNSKWVKLITLLVNCHDEIKKARLKLIYDDALRELMLTGDEQFGHDYYTSSMESMVSQPPAPGWTLYKEIEWIEITAVDNCKKLEAAIDTIGTFFKTNETGSLRIYAYT